MHVPKGTTHIVGNEKRTRILKVFSAPYILGTSKRPRQDFSYWHEAEQQWVYLGLITVKQYLINNRYEVKQTFPFIL